MKASSFNWLILQAIDWCHQILVFTAVLSCHSKDEGLFYTVWLEMYINLYFINMHSRGEKSVTEITFTLNEDKWANTLYSKLQPRPGVYAKTWKKAPSDKYSAFTMLLFLFTPQIRSEHLLQGAYVLVEIKMCTEFWTLAVGGRGELPKW